MPISDCEVRDPRIRRTRQLLQGALRSLMLTKSFDQISVQDITDLATVNRATFYDHYTDKFGLLEAMVAGGFHQLLHERNIKFDGTCRNALGAIVLATCDYLAQAHGGGDCEYQRVFQPLMDAAISTAIAHVLIHGMRTDPDAVLPAEVIAASASWAIYGAVKQWFATPNRPPVDEIIGPVIDLVQPMLENCGALRREA